MKKLLIIIFLFLINFNFASAETQFNDDGWKQKQSYEDGVNKYVKNKEDASYYCRLDNFRETECLRLSAIHLNDISVCPKQYLSSCSQKLAIKNNDISFCENDPESCYFQIGALEPSLPTETRLEACNKVKTERKQLCITNIAQAENDPEICSALQSDSEKEICLNRILVQLPKILEQLKKESGLANFTGRLAFGAEGFYKLYGTYALFFTILVALLFIFPKPFVRKSIIFSIIIVALTVLIGQSLPLSLGLETMAKTSSGVTFHSSVNLISNYFKYPEWVVIAYYNLLDIIIALSISFILIIKHLLTPNYKGRGNMELIVNIVIYLSIQGWYILQSLGQAFVLI